MIEKKVQNNVFFSRIWLVLGLLYYFRAITMTITVLPRPDPTYLCQPKVKIVEIPVSNITITIFLCYSVIITIIIKIIICRPPRA